MTSIPENSTGNVSIEIWLRDMYNMLPQHTRISNESAIKHIDIILSIIDSHRQYISDFYATILKQDLLNMQEDLYRKSDRLSKAAINNTEGNIKAVLDLLLDNDRSVVIYMDHLIKIDESRKNIFKDINHSLINAGDNNANNNNSDNNSNNSDNKIGDNNSINNKLRDIIKNELDDINKDKLVLPRTIIARLIDKLVDVGYFNEELKLAKEALDNNDKVFKKLDIDPKRNEKPEHKPKAKLNKNKMTFKHSHMAQEEIRTDETAFVNYIESVLTPEECNRCIAYGILKDTNVLNNNASSTPIATIIRTLNTMYKDYPHSIPDKVRQETAKKICKVLNGEPVDVFIDIINKLANLNDHVLNHFFTSNYNSARTLHQHADALNSMKDLLISIGDVDNRAFYAYGMLRHGEAYYTGNKDGKHIQLKTLCEGIAEKGVFRRNYEDREFGDMSTDDMDMSKAPIVSSNSKSKRAKSKVIAYDPIGDNTFTSILYRYTYPEPIRQLETSIIKSVTDDKEIYNYVCAYLKHSNYFICKFNNLPKYPGFEEWKSACISKEAHAFNYYIMHVGALHNIVDAIYKDFSDNFSSRNIKNYEFADNWQKLFNNNEETLEYLDMFRASYLYNILNKLSWVMQYPLKPLVVWCDSKYNYDTNETITTYSAKVINATMNDKVINYNIDIPENDYVVNVSSKYTPAMTTALLFDYKKFDIAIMCFDDSRDNNIDNVIEALDIFIEHAASICNDREFIRQAVLKCVKYAFDGLEEYIANSNDATQTDYNNANRVKPYATIM